MAIRNIRRDAVDTVKKLGKAKEDKVSEDSVKDAEDKIKKMTDKSVKKVDDIFASKEKEILTI